MVAVLTPRRAREHRRGGRAAADRRGRDPGDRLSLHRRAEGVSVPFFSGPHVYAALNPVDALEAVREAFVAHARGEWSMPSKVYVPAPPDGDFRAMPAMGAGHAVLKWVTSFPGNRERGLPTVAGVVLLSDATTGELKALLDAGAVTAL